MKSLIEICRALATALDAAAIGVEAMKGKVIGQLMLAAEEFIADQAAAVETAGIAEAALPLLYETQNRILNAILNHFEAEVIDGLLNKTIGPLRGRLEDAFNRLLYEEVAHVATGGPAPGLKLDTDVMLRHASRIQDQAEANRHGGRAFESQIRPLTFTTGG